ncbi:angiopoietin-related protein 1-like [Branchiostoma lanceolatum]|uniref:angiopoietin-related protein 1-like n=1 Tax=Branchiostoma lanceolatum TaxID=7740 RepID=UPI0034568E23
MDSTRLLLAAVVVAVVCLTQPAQGANKPLPCPKNPYAVPTQNTAACSTTVTKDIGTQKAPAAALKTKMTDLTKKLGDKKKTLEGSLTSERTKRVDLGKKVGTLIKKAEAQEAAAAATTQTAAGTQQAITDLKTKMQQFKTKLNALEAKANAVKRAAMSAKPGTTTGTTTGAKPGTTTGAKPGTTTGTNPGTTTGAKPGTTTGTNPGTATGTATKPTHPKDCGLIHQTDPSKKSGLYSTKLPGETSYVITYCDMDTDGGGWTVIQRRNAAIPTFDRPWNDYKNGFGQPMLSYWWGLEKVYKVTKGQNFRLRIEMVDTQGLRKYAVYDNFRIDTENNKYKLTVGKYSGNAGNALMTHNGMPFSTKDRDTGPYKLDSCAKAYKGGWWYNDHCFDANLNGYYSAKSPTGNAGFWLPFNGYKGLKESTMMIRHMNYNPPKPAAG